MCGWRIGVVLGIALLGLVPGQAPAHPTGAPFPPYVSPKADWTVNSGGGWHVLGAKAKVLRQHTLGYDSAGEKASDVWAPTCGRGPQTVAFTRQIDVPGVPATGVFAFAPSAFSFPMFESARLIVNDRPALRIRADALLRPSNAEFELTAAQLKLFRLGRNALTVVVTKKALPASAHACNTGSPLTLVGVSFALHAYSAADLSVTSSNFTAVRYVRGSSYGLDGLFTVHNAGPSAALPGAFSFETSFDSLEGAVDNLLSPVKAAAPFGACAATEGVVAGGTIKVTCPFGVFPAGATATVHMRIVVKIPADQPQSGVYPIFGKWTVDSLTHVTAPVTADSLTPDPNGDNNTQSEAWYLCGPQATDPKCPK